MLRVRSARNSHISAHELDWTPAEDCWLDHGFSGKINVLKVPRREDETEHRVYPHPRIADHVETAMLHEGEWYWIVRRNRGRRA